MKKLLTNEEIQALGVGFNELARENSVNLLENSDVQDLLPQRRRNTHKGSYGKVAIVGGSAQYFGAGYLSALAASKSGVGYTAWFLSEEMLKFAFLKIPEVLLIPTNEGGRYEFNEETAQKLCEYDSVALGMGMGVTEAVYETVLYLFENYTGRLVLDADGLNAISKFGALTDFLKIKKCEVVITPHLKELSRLTGVSMPDLQAQPFEFAADFTKKYPVTLLWKGAGTLIAKNGEVVLSATGCSAQAKGGSGDVLAGLIGGLCAQGVSAYDGARIGAYLFGLSAELAAKTRSEYCATPTDFIACFGEAFLQVLSGSQKCERAQKPRTERTQR